LLLEQYEVMPKPIVVELDKHPHGKELQEYIGEKTGRSTVPNVHVKGLSRGGNDDFQVWNREGLLSDKFKQWAGSVVSIQKRPTPPGT
jgi:glutaredoxin